MAALSLRNYVTQLEQHLPQLNMLDTNISNADVAWHIAHSLLTVNGIIGALHKSDPSKYSWSFNLTRSYIFASNKINRGKGKAPSVVQPKSSDLETIQQLLILCRERMDLLDNIPSTHFFHHPYLGNLRKKQTLKFLNIHTHHHLKIIEDIVASAKS
jgi:hypothetical protein